GSNSATNVSLTDLLPAGLTYTSSAPSQGTYAAGNSLVKVETLANGAIVTLALNATVNAGTNGTTLLNQAVVTAADQADPVATNNRDSVAITVQSADLRVTKVVNNATPNEGNAITYTVTLENNGPNSATNVALTDLLPAGLTYTSSTPSQGTY